MRDGNEAVNIIHIFSKYYHYAFGECQKFTTLDQLSFHRSSNLICAASNMALCVSADFCDQIAHEPVQSGPEPVEPDTEIKSGPEPVEPDTEVKPGPVPVEPDTEVKTIELKPIEPNPVELKPIELKPIELKLEPQDYEEPIIQFKLSSVEDEPILETPTEVRWINLLVFLYILY